MRGQWWETRLSTTQKLVLQPKRQRRIYSSYYLPPAEASGQWRSLWHLAKVRILPEHDTKCVPHSERLLQTWKDLGASTYQPYGNLFHSHCDNANSTLHTFRLWEKPLDSTKAYDIMLRYEYCPSMAQNVLHTVSDYYKHGRTRALIKQTSPSLLFVSWPPELVVMNVLGTFLKTT